MSFKKKVKLSKFVFACVYLSFYAAYAAYAIFYYKRYQNVLGILLISLVSLVLFLSAVTTFLSYRVNLLNERPSPFRHVLKIVKYTAQLIASSVTIVMVLSAVQKPNTFSLVMAIVSVPALIVSILLNVIAKVWKRKKKNGFGKKNFIPQPLYDEEGNEITTGELNLIENERAAAFRYFAEKEKEIERKSRAE